MKPLRHRLADFAASQPDLALALDLAGRSGCRLFLVGGAIRDAALGRSVGDLDLILAGPARPFLRRLARAVGHRVVTFRKRGIVDHRIRVGEREWDFVEPGKRSLRTEILRRDFTINAVAFDLLAGRLLDPSRGAADLVRRRLRALSDGIFRDDPLRMLRAVRLRAEIARLAIETRTRRMIARDAPLIRRVSPERIKAELDRILQTASASASFRLLDRLGLLRQVLPELDPLRGLGQNRYHHLDAFEHTLEALAAADNVRALARSLPAQVLLEDPLQDRSPGPAGGPREPGSPLSQVPRGARPVIVPRRALLLRWALLLHDTGKAETRAMGEDGEWHFFMHEAASRRIATAALKRLRGSRAETLSVERLVALHLRLSIPASGGMTPRALRRIVREAGSLTPLLVLHSIADKIASKGAGHARTLAGLRRAGRALLEAWKTEAERARRLPRLADGHDVMRILGLHPGPRVGTILAELEELQAEGHLAGRDDALEWLAQQGG